MCIAYVCKRCETQGVYQRLTTTCMTRDPEDKCMNAIHKKIGGRGAMHMGDG